MASWRELIAASGLPQAEAQLIAAAASGQARSWMMAHESEEAPASLAKATLAAFERRRAGEPAAYILGEREFYSLMLEITPDVLIPRPETEALVDLALAHLPQGGRLLDLGTGSGAIAIAIAHARPDAEVWASDISPAALALAHRNAARHLAKLHFAQGDGLQALGGERFHVIASNPPYVAANDLHLNSDGLPYEPRLALVSGSDGLQFIRRLAAEAPPHLHPGGWLLFEHGYDQGPACTALLAAMGYAAIEDRLDLAGQPRIALGRWAAGSKRAN